MKPKVFIGSSVEGLSVAYAVQQNLRHNAESTVWDQGVFDLSRTSIESLETTLQKIDFGIFVFSPDDISVIRDNTTQTVRDNVLFELGLFIGKLGRNRVFFIQPEGSDLHIPSDLTGITPGTYETSRDDGSLQAATGAVCNQIRTQINKVGPLHGDGEAEEASDSKGLGDSEDKEWLDHLIKNELLVAKEKLEKIIEDKSRKKYKQEKAWLLFIELKLNKKNALLDFRDYAAEHINETDIQKLISQMLIWEGYHEVAKELMEQAISKNKGSSDLIVCLANIFESNAEHDNAVEILTRAEPQVDPVIAVGLSELYGEGSLEAYQILRDCYEQYPNDKEIVFNLARCLQEHNRDIEALYLFNFLTLNHPDNYDYWAYLSNTCVSLDLYNKALTACQKARDLSDSKQSWILNNIGNILNNKGFYDEAISWLQKGLEIDVESEYGHDRLSKAIKNKEEQGVKYNDLIKQGRKLLMDRSMDVLH